MNSYIIYENCYYCGSPIRNQILDKDDSGKDFQLPYCSIACLNNDSESQISRKQIIADNIEFNKDGGKYKYLVKEISSEPSLNKIIQEENDKVSDSSDNKINKVIHQGRNYVTIIYKLFGIGLIVLISVALIKSHNKDLTIVIIGKSLPILIIPLINELWDDFKN